MRTGILLTIVGVVLFTRTIFKDQQGQTIVGRILDGAGQTPAAPSTPTASSGAPAAAIAGPLAPRKTLPMSVSHNHPGP